MSKIRSRHELGIQLPPTNIEGVGGEDLTKEGEIAVDSSDSKLKVRLENSTQSVVTEDQTQELTNKTIDADSNTIENLEVDNLKSGVLNTSTSLDGASDAQIPSAKATKDYVDNAASTVQVDVDDLIALSGVPANSTDLGTFTGNIIPNNSTNKQALQSLETSVDAHTSAIMDLSEEIQDLAVLSGVPINSTDLGSFTGSTIPDNSTIKEALQSLETSTEVHADSTSNVHGVTGNVVGTTDTQTLTNKTLDGGTVTGVSIQNPSRLDAKQDTKANLITYATTATNGQFVFATDEKKAYQVVDGLLQPIGGGSQGLDIAFQLYAEEELNSWTTNLSASATFVKDSSTPLNGDSSYILTRGSGLDQLTSPIQTVRLKFVEQNCILNFTYSYDGDNGDIELTLLDSTDTEIPNSKIQLAATNGKITTFRKRFYLFDTAISGVKFKIDGVVANSGKVLRFDDIQLELDKNEAFVAEIEGDWQQVQLIISGPVVNNTDLSIGSKLLDEGNSTLFTLSSEGVTFLRDAEVFTSVTGRSESGSLVTNARIQLNSSTVSQQLVRPPGGESPHLSSASWSFRVSKGDKIAYNASTDTTNISIYAKARSQVVVYPDETFSTDINPVYWKATPCGDDEIGCYNTYSFAANTNTPVLCTTRPDQLDADMRVNGIKVFTRAYNAPSTCAEPARVEVRLPKGMSTPTRTIYKDSSRQVVGQLGYTTYVSGGSPVGASRGPFFDTYNPNTGLLIFDVGIVESANTHHRFVFSNDTHSSSSYLVIKASKTGAVLANKLPRELVKVVESGVGWAHIYSDGWVEQQINQDMEVPASSFAAVSINYIVPLRDISYVHQASVRSQWTGMTAIAYQTHTASGGIILTNNSGATRTITGTVFARHYGAASYLLENFGIKVGY